MSALRLAVDLSQRGSRCPHCGITAAPWDDRGTKMNLAFALELAVPLWLDVLAGMLEEDRERHIMWWTQTAIEVVAFKGDDLQYGSRKKGEAAEHFNYLASALAGLAYAPGGVTFAGRHWCTA